MGNVTKIYYSLSGLFHDIGKFYQRSFENLEKFKKEDFEYSHAYYTYKFFDDFFKNVFPSELFEILRDSAYHHSKKDEFYIEIIRKADYLSASERERKREEKDEIMYKEKRLHSVFTRFSSNNNQNFFYRLAPLKLDKECIYPSNESKKDDNYKILWSKFQNELNNFIVFLSKNFGKNDLKEFLILEKVFNKFYYLLYKYTWCIPSDTYSKEKKGKQYSDISLFDHSRIVAAFSSCLSNLINSKGEIEYTDFILMKVDISGIQKFLFNVKSGEGGIAKRLRGRSFFLTILPEFISRLLVRKLDYTISNILFCGGGNFEIIITNKDIKNVTEMLNKINKYLLKEFEGELGIVYEYVEFSENDIRDPKKFLEVNDKLNKKLVLKKFHKYSELSENIHTIINENFDNIKNKSLCKSCNLYFTEKEDDFCKWCEKFLKIGSFVPKMKYLIFSEKQLKNYSQFSEFIEIPFKEFGYIYLIENISSSDYKNLWMECLDIYEIIESGNHIKLEDFSTGFKFIAKYLPKNKDGNILTFEEIAESSEGDKKLGILKMDVDNLSQIFNNIEILSFSRKANLSRSIDLFFSGMINEICKDDMHYILYSGGDDLFIISPWDKCIEVADKINTEFHKYTCYSNKFTLSAGITVLHPKYPVNSFANLVDDAEKFAKDNGKNKLSIFNTLINWDELKKANNFINKILTFLDEKKINKSFCYKILQLLKLYAITKKDEFIKIKEKPDPKFYPFIFYFFKRNFYGDDNEKEEFLFEALDKYFNNLYYIMNYVLTKTREVK